jgi:hypothetical protein
LTAKALFFCRPPFPIAKAKHSISNQTAQWRRINPEVIVCLLQALYENVQDGVDIVRRYEDNVEVFDVDVGFGRTDEVIVVLNVGYVECLGL